MEVKNWTSAGKIRADRIDAEVIVAKLGEFGSQIKVKNDIVVGDGVHCNRITFGITSITSSAKWRPLLIDGIICNVLCDS